MKKTIIVETDKITKELGRSFDYEFDGESFFDVPKLPKLPQKFGIDLIVGQTN